jgi:hypothetical protein
MSISASNDSCDGDALSGMHDSIGAVSDSGEEYAEMPLTDGKSATNVDTDAFGELGMAEDPRLETAFQLIRDVIADADKRAASKMVERITSAAGISPREQPQLFQTPHSPDKRAPHGSAGVLIDRALAEAGDNGLTVAGIQAKAETEFEKMVSTSAIRNWLRECERKHPPRYRQVGGVWFLASHGPTMKVVG